MLAVHIGVGESCLDFLLSLYFLSPSLREMAQLYIIALYKHTVQLYNYGHLLRSRVYMVMY